MSFFDHSITLSRKDSYFAASNTHRGFVSYFPTLFAPYRKLIIKGGPGSGKSTLMKKTAIAAEEAGLAVERYYCSSDTDSLDAVVIPALKVVILDGTPPHTTEPDCPGAVDEIIDLTALWNKALLRERADTVAALNREISMIYRRVYALMAAIRHIEDTLDLTVENAFNHTVSQKIAGRLLDKYRITGTGDGTITARPVTAFGVKGYVTLDSNTQNAKTVISIKDRGFFSQPFFTILQKELLARGVRCYLAPRPIDEKTESLYLPDDGILIERNADNAKCDGIINLDRMLPERGKGMLKGQRSLIRGIDSLCEEVKALLCRAGKLHDELETHYIAAANYDALNTCTETVIGNMLN